MIDVNDRHYNSDLRVGIMVKTTKKTKKKQVVINQNDPLRRTSGGDKRKVYLVFREIWLKTYS